MPVRELELIGPLPSLEVVRGLGEFRLRAANDVWKRPFYCYIDGNVVRCSGEPQPDAPRQQPQVEWVVPGVPRLRRVEVKSAWLTKLSAGLLSQQEVELKASAPGVSSWICIAGKLHGAKVSVTATGTSRVASEKPSVDPNWAVVAEAEITANHFASISGVHATDKLTASATGAAGAKRVTASPGAEVYVHTGFMGRIGFARRELPYRVRRRGARAGQGLYEVPDAEDQPDYNGQGGECTVCMEKEKVTVIFPCMHCALCVGCARQRLTNCPVCRAKITAVKRIYG
eukprot:TRINITY_DN18737_c0_g2_i1.p1 TRINITY_DN18737_c0_g2~~TRINITY_DN18737_c0_g2_i1.p1  ORF type:complete len:286 (+),score=61.60 TRINITY_DN18737_c0_g2_i1:75-932(+)